MPDGEIRTRVYSILGSMVPPEDGAECPKWVQPSGSHHDGSPARGSLPRFSSPNDHLSAIRRPLNALPITGVAHLRLTACPSATLPLPNALPAPPCPASPRGAFGISQGQSSWTSPSRPKRRPFL